MKSVFSLLSAISLLSAGTGRLLAQVTTTYGFSQSNGTYAPIVGGTVLGTGAMDDNNYTNLSIGFPFVFNGISQSVFSVNANGYLALGPTVANTYTALSTGSSNHVVAALNHDMEGLANAELRYQVLGTAPNRTLVVQWARFASFPAATNLDDTYNFQIVLHETTNRVQILYGPMAKNATPREVQVGLRGNANTDFNNRTTTADWSASTAGTANTATMTLGQSVLPATGLSFSWLPVSFSVSNAAVSPSAQQCGGVPHAVTATVADAGGVSNVAVAYSVNGIAQTPVPMVRISGDAFSGVWSATLPPTVGPERQNVSYGISAIGSNGIFGTFPVGNYLEHYLGLNAGPDQTIDPGVTATLTATVDDSSRFPILFTEITHFETGLGATTPYPAYIPTATLDFDGLELSNVHSTAPIAVGGLQIVVWSSQTASFTYTIPPGTIIPPAGTAVFAHNNTPSSPANRFFSMASGLSPSSTASYGYVLRTAGGAIIDAAATGGFSFPAASGVTAADWSGNIANSPGRAGVLRNAATDSNRSNDWALAASGGPLQTIGSFNPTLGTVNTVFSSFTWNPGAMTGPQITVGPFAPGNHTFTVQYTDPSGCSAQDEVTIVVNNLCQPIPLSMVNTPVSCPGSSDGALDLTVGGGTGPFLYAWSNGASTEDLSSLGVGPYAVTVTDAFGCTATAPAVLSVADTSPPVLVCPANILLAAPNGSCSAVATFTVAATDACSVAVAFSPPSGSVFSLGSTAVVATATDASGNTATCSFSVTVADALPPILACPTAQALIGNGPVPLGNFVQPGSATDNCSVASVVQTPAPGTLIVSAQVVQVTLTAADASGNTAACSFSVTVDVCPSVPGVIYVDDDAPGANNGTSWANAFRNLQSALSAATPGTQIWVAAGTYRPTAGTNRGETFSLRPGVAVYGGFPGNGTGCSPAHRDWQAHPTILSGNIGDPAVATDNSHRVVTANNVGASSVLDGFHLVDARSNGNGGGLYVQASGAGQQSSPTLARLRVADNRASAKGAGTCLYAVNGGLVAPVFQEVAFEGNEALYDGGGLCAMAQGASLQASFNGCVFLQNQTPQKGGALYAWAASGGNLSLDFSACSFGGNTAGALGGAGYHFSRSGGNLQISSSDCEFTDNAAPHGGAFYQHAAGGALNLQTERSLFSGNVATVGNGGAICFLSEFAGGGNQAVLSNALFENNSSAQGGALFVSTLRAGQTAVQVSATRFANNSAAQNGGGAFHYTLNTGSASALQFTNCVFQTNTANKSGGALYLNANTSSPMPTGLTNCTLYGNGAGTGGCAHNIAATAASNLSLRNCIARNNPTTDPTSRTFVNVGATANISLVHNLLDALPCTAVTAGNGVLSCGAGNLAAQPGFVNAGAGDFHLTAASGAIDAGQTAGAPAVDFDGSPRPQGGGVDMGAFEFGGARPLSRMAGDGETNRASVFPNPTSGTFSVVFERPFTGLLQMFDPQGRLIAAQRLNAQSRANWTLDAHSPGGTYLLRATHEAGEIQTMRVVLLTP